MLRPETDVAVLVLSLMVIAKGITTSFGCFLIEPAARKYSSRRKSNRGCRVDQSKPRRGLHKIFWIEPKLATERWAPLLSTIGTSACLRSAGLDRKSVQDTAPDRSRLGSPLNFECQPPSAPDAQAPVFRVGRAVTAHPRFGQPGLTKAQKIGRLLGSQHAVTAVRLPN
jgi:hypothetical protein